MHTVSWIFFRAIHWFCQFFKPCHGNRDGVAEGDMSCMQAPYIPARFVGASLVALTTTVRSYPTLFFCVFARAVPTIWRRGPFADLLENIQYFHEVAFFLAYASLARRLHTLQPRAMRPVCCFHLYVFISL